MIIGGSAIINTPYASGKAGTVLTGGGAMITVGFRSFEKRRRAAMSK
jgi:hypothetical protein